jgi:ferritin-like metal-binding protein YciE
LLSTLGEHSRTTAALGSDDMPTNCIAGQALEHFEIALYRSLRAAAE